MIQAQCEARIMSQFSDTHSPDGISHPLTKLILPRKVCASIGACLFSEFSLSKRLGSPGGVHLASCELEVSPAAIPRCIVGISPAISSIAVRDKTARVSCCQGQPIHINLHTNPRVALEWPAEYSRRMKWLKSRRVVLPLSAEYPPQSSVHIAQAD